MQIGEYIKQIKVEQIKPRVRNDVSHAIWNLLQSESEIAVTKRKNIDTFKEKAKSLGLIFHIKDYPKFAKTEFCIKPLTYIEMATHLKPFRSLATMDYIHSICKDKLNRKYSVGAYIRSFSKKEEVEKVLAQKKGP